MVKNSWRSLDKETIQRNFLSALSITMINFPFSLSIVLWVNDRLTTPILTFPSSVLTVVLGSFSVLVYSAGRILFRTFTGLLFPIVASSMEHSGKEGLASVSLYLTVILLAGVIFNVFRYVKYIPAFIFEGIKNGTGCMLIMGDVYSLLAIKRKGSSVNI